MTLTRPSKKSALVGTQPTLAIHFTPAAARVWRQAHQTQKQEAFCIWPVKNGGGMSIIDIRLRSKRLALALPSDALSTGAYTCGLHARTGGAEGSWPWLGYVRSALVAARLSLVHD